MDDKPDQIATGTCTCGACRYALTARPMIVHACHCTWCQRETGSAFVLNGWIEAHHVVLKRGTLVEQTLPSESGRGQIVFRCADCKIVLWSIYSSNLFRFVRLGTLDTPGQFAPDVHIFTNSKQPWLPLPDDAPCFPEFYRRSEVWPPDSLARYHAAIGKS